VVPFIYQRMRAADAWREQAEGGGKEGGGKEGGGKEGGGKEGGGKGAAEDGAFPPVAGILFFNHLNLLQVRR
jgi:hypothetical protein